MDILTTLRREKRIKPFPLHFNYSTSLQFPPTCGRKLLNVYIPQFYFLAMTMTGEVECMRFRINTESILNQVQHRAQHRVQNDRKRGDRGRGSKGQGMTTMSIG